jgi:hypothetical protein
VNSYIDYREELSKSLVPIGKMFAQKSKEMSEAIGISKFNLDLNLGFMKKIGEKIERNIQKIFIATENAVRILEKYGWLLPPSIDIRIASSIYNLENKSGCHLKEINELILDYYQRDNFEEIEFMIKTWESNKLFKKRIRILRDCLKTLQLSKKFENFNAANVVLPTLIAQIDGILTDYAVYKGFDIKNYPNHQVLRKLEEYKENIIKRHKTGEEYDTFAKWDNLFKDIFLSTLWGTAYPRKRPKTGYIHTRFNRHKILHGEYVGYGSIYNVLRAFFLLDFISKLN